MTPYLQTSVLATFAAAAHLVLGATQLKKKRYLEVSWEVKIAVAIVTTPHHYILYIGEDDYLVIVDANVMTHNCSLCCSLNLC